jgi:protein-disulfide isomerase
MHPWAFAAAVAGRAIYRQKPALFWEYKKQIYANQDKLNAFLIDDFARGFAQDHDLDLKKYDADVNSADLQKGIIDGAGLALSNDVRATPTYMVNGIVVDPGNDGKYLESYIAGLLKK